MIVFRYDKTWEGLLSAFFDMYHLKKFPDQLLGPDQSWPLLTTFSHEVQAEEQKSQRVMRGLQQRLTRLGLKQLLYGWLSEQPDNDITLINYMRAIFASLKSPENNFSNPEVLALRRLAQITAKEIMYAKQFVRFQQTAQDVYFALIVPACNILPLITGHFTSRFKDQKWVIYDGRREYGFFWDLAQLHKIELEPQAKDASGFLSEQYLTANEKLFQKAWQKYYHALCIEQRRNPKLHRQFVPERFWAYLTEKQSNTKTN